MSDAPTPPPTHPRLADHAQVRRYVRDGVEQILVIDTRTSSLFRIEPADWALLRGADGTRDLDGIALAAAQSGVYHRYSDVTDLLVSLQERDLLAGGVLAPRLEPPPIPAERPLEVLPGFSLHCDGSGHCCALYGTIIFTDREADRARVHCPDVLDADALRLFTPEAGTVPRGRLAVASHDGACPYLGPAGRCAIHARAGAESKPRGCRVYPATFIDDGETLRVSAGVECPCILESVGREGGAPLVPAGARARGDLPADLGIARLSDTHLVDTRVTATRADLRAWSRAVAGATAQARACDVAELLWSLAGVASGMGVDPDAARATAAAPVRPAATALQPWIDALGRRARSVADSFAQYRAEHDHAFVLVRAIAAACDALDDAIASGAWPDRTPHAASEAFWLRAALHGHLLFVDTPLVAALRDRTIRILLARTLHGRAELPASVAKHPLAAVEAMMRGHGLKAYVRDVGRQAEPAAQP